MTPFWGEGSLTKIDYKKGYPFSNLSTGGPRRAVSEGILSGVTFAEKPNMPTLRSDMAVAHKNVLTWYLGIYLEPKTKTRVTPAI